MKNRLLMIIAVLFLFLETSAATPWSAKWIQAADCTNGVNTWQVFRKNVSCNSVPKRLIARISVDSKYWLWINGKMCVYEGGLKRGPSPESSYYDEINIAPYLRKGDNTIAVLTVFFGKEGFSHKNSGLAAMLFDAQSKNVRILSDGSWEAAVYKAYETVKKEVPNWRLPESSIRFDGRRDLGKWYAPDYIGHFPKARVVGEQAVNVTMGQLVKRPIPQFVYRYAKYVSTWFDENTRILHCRLPYNAQVCPLLKVEAPAGKVIDMRTEDFVITGENSVRGEYVTRDGVQQYESMGWMNGNEVRYNIPEGVKVLDVGYCESGYDTKDVSDFRCNDSFFNELFKRSVRTMYVNMRDTYFDCPDRERAQWWGDVVNDIQQNFYCLSTSSWKIIDKGIYELMNWQRADGTIFSPIPAGNWDKELPVQMLMAVGWYGFYTQYYYSGNDDFIKPVYGRLKKYLHEVWKLDEDGFVKTRQGGWSWADWGDHIDLDLITNEWYYLALKAEKQFAARMNIPEDVARIDEIMQNMARKFDSRYWTGKDFRSQAYKEAASDDRAQALAVVSGLASPDKYPAMLDVFKTSRFSSPLLEMYVQQALFQMGQGEFALQRARERYSQMLDFKNQTTLFELWDTGGSINHAWSGCMVTVFGRHVCGIEPTSPGFRTFRVKPQMAGLTDVSQNIETRYGLIKCHLKQTGGRLQVDLTVPKGTRAEVIAGNTTKNVGAGNRRLTF